MEASNDAANSACGRTARAGGVAFVVSLLGPQLAIANANKNGKLNRAERAAERFVND